MVRIFLCFVVLCFTTVHVLAAKRVALVVGNAAYEHAPKLGNPENDANDISAALERLGFDVIRGTNLDNGGMRQKAREFSAKLKGAETGLFFYAGHGLQVRGTNYLVPVDSKLGTESDLDFGTVRVDLILRQMEREVPTSIVFLDACRDNPLAKDLARSMGTRSANIGRGLAQVETGVGTLIAFATQPGNVALDGTGRNSPFTTALLQHIERPGLDLGDVMIEVRNSVLNATSGQQVPWEHSSLTGRVYFSNKKKEADGIAGQSVDQQQDTEKIVEVAFWNSIRESSNPQLFQSYLGRYPEGEFALLANLKIDELAKTASRKEAQDSFDDSNPAIGNQLADIQSRLYELNYDPGIADGQMGPNTRSAIVEFQQQAGIAVDGSPTSGLLSRLQSLGGLKPWGAIVFSASRQDWGMSWGAETRKAAIASAQRSCGSRQCESELSFYGTECGVFAHSDNSWAITARSTLTEARKAALDDCQSNGANCRVIATVCADGAEQQAINE